MELKTGFAQRRCAGTNRDGLPCGRYPIPGGTVCVMHGGNTAQVRQAAQHRLLAMVEPILDVFQEVVEVWQGTRCTTCNRPTGDPMPVIRVGQLVLDRSGLGPHATMTLHRGNDLVNPFDKMSTAEIITELEGMLATVRATRARELKAEHAPDALKLIEGEQADAPLREDEREV